MKQYFEFDVEEVKTVETFLTCYISELDSDDVYVYKNILHFMKNLRQQIKQPITQSTIFTNEV